MQPRRRQIRELRHFVILCQGRAGQQRRLVTRTTPKMQRNCQADPGALVGEKLRSEEDDAFGLLPVFQDLCPGPYCKDVLFLPSSKLRAFEGLSPSAGSQEENQRLTATSFMLRSTQGSGGRTDHVANELSCSSHPPAVGCTECA